MYTFIFLLHAAFTRERGGKLLFATRHWSKPAADFRVDLFRVEQVEVIHSVADPLPVLGER
jgi:hypothetical protein